MQISPFLLERAEHVPVCQLPLFRPNGQEAILAVPARIVPAEAVRQMLLPEPAVFFPVPDILDRGLGVILTYKPVPFPIHRAIG